jgi:hypothetical protein
MKALPSYKRELAHSKSSHPKTDLMGLAQGGGLSHARGRAQLKDSYW